MQGLWTHLCGQFGHEVVGEVVQLGGGRMGPEYVHQVDTAALPQGVLCSLTHQRSVVVQSRRKTRLQPLPPLTAQSEGHRRKGRWTEVVSRKVWL